LEFENWNLIFVTTFVLTQTIMNIKELNSKQALAEIKKGALFVDVREPYELEEVAYDIQGMVHIPLGEIQDRIDEFPKNREIIIGCRSGKRSMNACMFLAMNGYTNVRNLHGGIIGWVEDGAPTK
jgi:rhodanese-related sulfurtransferase